VQRTSFKLRGFSPTPHFAAASAAIAALVLFCLHLPGTVTAEDSGEFIVAVATLGIPHPPGYPAYCLAAHPFTWLPWGTLAWRVAFASAFFGAATIYCVARVGARATGGAWGSAVAAFGLACTPSFFSQAIIAEVYTLNALCLALAILLIVNWEQTRGERLLVLLALLFGVSTGVHNTTPLLAPLFAGYVVWASPGVLRRPGLLLGVVGALLAGLLVQLYLPLRSLANPPLDWGNPETLANWWRLLSREQFQFMYDQYPRGLGRFVGQIFGLCREHLGVVSLLGLGGLWFVRPRRLGVLLLGVAVVSLVSIVWVQNPEATPEWDAVMRVFMIPTLLALSLGLAALLQHAVALPRTRVALLAAVCLLIVMQAARTVPLESKRGYLWADVYARGVLAQLPAEALLFAGPDYAAFPILYLQVAEGLRRDVRLANPYGYVDAGLYAAAPEALRDAWGAFPRRGVEPEIVAWILARETRPVYFTDRPALVPGAGFVFRQEGLVYRAVPGGSDVAPVDAWGHYGLEIPKRPEGLDFMARAICAEFAMKRAEHALAVGDSAEGGRWATRAALLAPQQANYLNNIAGVCARGGAHALAERLFGEALELEPENGTIRRNLERLRELGAGAQSPASSSG